MTQHSFDEIDKAGEELKSRFLRPGEECEVVYKWLDNRRLLRLGRRLAIKIYKDRYRCREAYCMMYARERIGVKCPRVFDHGQIHGKFTYVVMEWAEGTNLGKILGTLSNKEKANIQAQIDDEVGKMKSATSSFIGNFTLDDEYNIKDEGYVSDGNIFDVLQPARFFSPPLHTMDEWYALAGSTYKSKSTDEQQPQAFVFSHNDLCSYNVLVNPETLTVTSIIDWEYAGFYPVEYEPSKGNRSLLSNGRLDLAAD
ncbi:hypothetical protein GGI12_004923 [Dipsacomyces acuminosporus]|nr:hypothetical protein GGI12_004923 [Dipsacomyces acuminosporus]